MVVSFPVIIGNLGGKTKAHAAKLRMRDEQAEFK
jgi:hypothetical protein